MPPEPEPMGSRDPERNGEDGDVELPIDPDLLEGATYRPDPRLIVAVAAGGSIGGPARYLVSQVASSPETAFPWSTLAVNLSGSVLLGFALVFLIERFRPTRFARAFFGTGFCGAYTTMSAFALETDLLVRDGMIATAATYVIASLVGGLVCVWVGMTAARRLPAHPNRVAGGVTG